MKVRETIEDVDEPEAPDMDGVYRRLLWALREEGGVRVRTKAVALRAGYIDDTVDNYALAIVRRWLYAMYVAGIVKAPTYRGRSLTWSIDGEENE